MSVAMVGGSRGGGRWWLVGLASTVGGTDEVVGGGMRGGVGAEAVGG